MLSRNHNYAKLAYNPIIFLAAHI